MVEQPWGICVNGSYVTTKHWYRNHNKTEQNETVQHDLILRDDIIKWKHFFALLALYAGNTPVTGEFLAQRPVTRSFDVFFDLRWINGWVNNHEAGDLRRHHVHYDVTVMETTKKSQQNKTV